jgi:hypothetical protein
VREGWKVEGSVHDVRRQVQDDDKAKSGRRAQGPSKCPEKA